MLLICCVNTFHIDYFKMVCKRCIIHESILLTMPSRSCFYWLMCVSYLPYWRVQNLVCCINIFHLTSSKCFARDVSSMNPYCLSCLLAHAFIGWCVCHTFCMQLSTFISVKVSFFFAPEISVIISLIRAFEAWYFRWSGDRIYSSCNWSIVTIHACKIICAASWLA
jgi:hypothetical protein